MSLQQNMGCLHVIRKIETWVHFIVSVHFALESSDEAEQKNMFLLPFGLTIIYSLAYDIQNFEVMLFLLLFLEQAIMILCCSLQDMKMLP